MSRHTGGVKGFEYPTGKCPHCKRRLAGSRMIDKPGYMLRLRRHKVEGRHPGRPWCRYDGEPVEMIR